LNHPSSTKIAKELLQKIIENVHESTSEDLGTVSSIIEMKVKPAHLSSYQDCISQLIKNNPLYPKLALRHFLHNETLTHRPMNNTKLLQFIFKSLEHENANIQLGHVLQEMAALDQYQQSMRVLVKRVVKALCMYTIF